MMRPSPMTGCSARCFAAGAFAAGYATTGRRTRPRRARARKPRAVRVARGGRGYAACHRDGDRHARGRGRGGAEHRVAGRPRPAGGPSARSCTKARSWCSTCAISSCVSSRRGPLARRRVPAWSAAGDGGKRHESRTQASLVRQSKGGARQARLVRGRMTELHHDGIVAKSELDTAEADYRVAEARYNEAQEVRRSCSTGRGRRTQLHIAEQQLADATLRAPFDGAVRERHLSVGGYLDVGAPVLTIVKMHPLRLPRWCRSATPHASPSDRTSTSASRPERASARGKVARLSPAVDEATRTVMIEAEVPNRGTTPSRCVRECGDRRRRERAGRPGAVERGRDLRRRRQRSSASPKDAWSRARPRRPPRRRPRGGPRQRRRGRDGHRRARQPDGRAGGRPATQG